MSFNEHFKRRKHILKKEGGREGGREGGWVGLPGRW